MKRLFGIMGAIAKSLQTMVYADTVDELIKRENRVKEILDRVNTDQLKDASIRKRQIEELYNTLSDITDHTFITLPVFTAGTLSNSYAESINSCLRKIGLTALGTSRLESIFLLRNYCKSCVPVIKTYSKERRVLLEKYMQPDVIDVVSNGVLRHQAKQIEQVEKICKILQEDGSIFTIEEVIEKKLTKDSLIRRKAKRHVSWNGTGGVSCSCNGLVYRGMPCMHISLIAIAKNFKIPLACFNKRYCYEIPDVRQPENSLPESSSQQLTTSTFS